MTQHLLQFVPLVGMLMAVLIAIGVYWWQSRSFKSVVAAYQRIIEHQDQRYINAMKEANDRFDSAMQLERTRYEAALDRIFLTKQLPPSKADLGTEYEERRERQKQRQAEQDIQRKNGGPLPQRIGPLEEATLQMEREQETASASAKLRSELEARKKELNQSQSA